MGPKPVPLDYWLFVESGREELLTVDKYQQGSSQHTINHTHVHTDGPG